METWRKQARHYSTRPIRYADPWGLFKWNESDDHIFALRREVETAGGSISWNAMTSTATVDIYGVTVSFNRYSDGVQIVDGRMQIRADAFYSTVVSAAEEMVFLGEHGAFVPTSWNPFGHASVIIFIPPHHSLYNAPIFSREGGTRWGNVRYATIGGTSDGTAPFLSGTTSSEKDRNLAIKTSMQLIHSGSGMALSLFAANTHFNAHNNRGFLYHVAGGRARISIVPGHLISVQGYNSNSYARSLLNAVGLSPTPVGSLPGWNTRIGTSYFGQ